MPSEMIDLRSDTVTRPSPGMRQAIAEAEVGDDMMGEDPTVNRLEARLCEMLGKEAAVYACSGTQSNQLAVRAHCQSGEELLIEESGHIANFEGGGAAALSGVSVRTLQGRGGLLSVADVTGKIRPNNQHYCQTRLLCLENTTNYGGGRVYTLDRIRELADWAHEHGLKVHVDGARLFNACVAGGYTPGEVAGLVDSVSLCFSKGLGCPMGSMLVGDAATIQKARRARKLFGGALRQAGMMAAAAMYALDHHVERLAEDHVHAQEFARTIAEIPGVLLDPAQVETNLVFFDIAPERATAGTVAARLKEHQVYVYATAPQTIRVCTHLDVTKEQLHHAAMMLRKVLGGQLVPIYDETALAY